MWMFVFDRWSVVYFASDGETVNSSEHFVALFRFVPVVLFKMFNFSILLDRNDQKHWDGILKKSTNTPDSPGHMPFRRIYA
eukprot:scaffold2102_cov161-Amphora_coffeaeformis.AAC.38